MCGCLIDLSASVDMVKLSVTYVSGRVVHAKCTFFAPASRAILQTCRLVVPLTILSSDQSLILIKRIRTPVRVIDEKYILFLKINFQRTEFRLETLSAFLLTRQNACLYGLPRDSATASAGTIPESGIGMTRIHQ